MTQEGSIIYEIVTWMCVWFFFSRAGRKWIGFPPSVTEMFSSFAKDIPFEVRSGGA